MSRFATNLIWLLAYVAMLTVLIGSMIAVRGQMIAALDTPEAQAEWEAWRAEVRKQVERGGPVQRRVPRSPEPNALVLLRDHFETCVAAAVFFCSLLFFVMMLLLRGALRQPPP